MMMMDGVSASHRGCSVGFLLASLAIHPLFWSFPSLIYFQTLIITDHEPRLAPTFWRQLGWGLCALECGLQMCGGAAIGGRSSRNMASGALMMFLRVIDKRAAPTDVEFRYSIACGARWTRL